MYFMQSHNIYVHVHVHVYSLLYEVGGGCQGGRERVEGTISSIQAIYMYMYLYTVHACTCM